MVCLIQPTIECIHFPLDLGQHPVGLETSGTLTVTDSCFRLFFLSLRRTAPVPNCNPFLLPYITTVTSTSLGSIFPLETFFLILFPSHYILLDHFCCLFVCVCFVLFSINLVEHKELELQTQVLWHQNIAFIAFASSLTQKTTQRHPATVNEYLIVRAAEGRPQSSPAPWILNSTQNSANSNSLVYSGNFFPDSLRKCMFP